MSKFRKESYFLGMIAYSKNKDQILYILKGITTAQFKLFESIATNILEGKYSLSKKNFNILKKYKSFLRKLSEGKVSKLSLQKNFKALRDIIKITLKHYEICGQICISTNRKVGKNKSDYIIKGGKGRENNEYPESRSSDSESNISINSNTSGKSNQDGFSDSDKETE